MKKYHKIHTIFKRNPENKKELLEGDFSLPEFEFLSENNWIFTEKVDGTNIRVIFTPGEGVEFKGKTDEAVIPNFLCMQLAKIFNHKIKDIEKDFPDGVCFYGEGYGSKIQRGGGNYRVDQSFVLFDVKVGDWWLKRDAVEEIGSRFNIDVVPVVGSGTIYDAIEIVRKGFISRWGNFFAEGIIAVPSVELKTRAGERVITKIKHCDFVKKELKK